MSEQLQVGAAGGLGIARSLGTGQLRILWRSLVACQPQATFLDGRGGALRRYPGDAGWLLLDDDGGWLIDLGSLPESVATIKLLASFDGAGSGAFDATLGELTLRHPGMTVVAAERRLLCRIDRAEAGWRLVPAAQIVHDDFEGEPHPEGPDQRGRAIVVLDTSGSMMPPILDGTVAHTVRKIARSDRARSITLVAAASGQHADLTGSDGNPSQAVGRFLSAVVGRAPTSTSQVEERLAMLSVGADDHVVVVTDGPPASLDRIFQVLGDHTAEWWVVHAAELSAAGADRRRWDALETAGHVIHLGGTGS